MKENLMQRFRAHFVSGLLVLAPLFITVLVIGYLVHLADASIVNPLFRLLPFEIEANFKIFTTKLAIALVVILFVCAVGWTAEKFIFKGIFTAGETLLKNIPVFNKVYLSIKEISQAFFGDKTGVFKRVVVIEYPRKGLYALGFVTQEKRWNLHEKTGRDIVSVFVPHPPNPATGFLAFAPKDELIEINLTVEEGLKLVISGGAAVPRS